MIGGCAEVHIGATDNVLRTTLPSIKLGDILLTTWIYNIRKITNINNILPGILILYLRDNICPLREWGRIKSFDVVVGSTQVTPSAQSALLLAFRLEYYQLRVYNNILLVLYIPLSWCLFRKA